MTKFKFNLRDSLPPEAQGADITVSDVRLFEVSLVAEAPNPDYGVYPIERVEDVDG